MSKVGKCVIGLVEVERIWNSADFDFDQFFILNLHDIPLSLSLSLSVTRPANKRRLAMEY